MTYEELTTSALSIADRQDTETVNEMPTFFRIIESKVNRFLRTQNAAIRSVTPIIPYQYEYTVPDGFESLRSIKLRPFTDSTFGGFPLRLVNPEQFTNLIKNQSNDYFYYISGNEFIVYPLLENHYIEIYYNGKVEPLSESNTTNWLSIDHPDCYLFGLVAEINAFVKDANAAQLWLQRFNDSLEEIKRADQLSVYSGNPMQIMLG